MICSPFCYRILVSFVSGFEKLGRDVFSFVVYARSSDLSVLMEQLGSYRADFREIWYLRVLRKSAQKIPVSLKIKHKFHANSFFPPKKSCLLWDNGEKYGGASQSTNDIIRRKNDRIYVPDNCGESTDTHSEYVMLIVGSINNSTTYFAARRQCQAYPLLHFHYKTERCILLTATLAPATVIG